MVDKKTVEHVAQLARVAISEEEKESLGDQLSKIIDYIDKLKELKVEGVAPLRGLHIAGNIFREDKAVLKPAEDILNNVPLRQDNFIKIPKVIE